MTFDLRRIVAVCACSTLALAACGGGDDDGKDADTKDATTTVEAETTTTSSASDGGSRDDLEALAKSALLTADDMPGGWQMVDEQGDSEDDQAEVEGCPELKKQVDAVNADNGRDPVDATRTFTVASDDTPSVESSAAVFKNADIAGRAADLIVAEEALSCMLEAMTQQMETSQPGIELGQVEITPLTVDEGDADQAGGQTVVVPMTVQGVQATLRLDFVAIRAGEIVHTLMATSIDDVAPFPELTDVVDAAVQRTASAAASA